MYRHNYVIAKSDQEYLEKDNQKCQTSNHLVSVRHREKEVKNLFDTGFMWRENYRLYTLLKTKFVANDKPYKGVDEEWVI